MRTVQSRAFLISLFISVYFWDGCKGNKRGYDVEGYFFFFFSRALHILDYVLGIKPVFKASSAYFRKGLALFGDF